MAPSRGSMTIAVAPFGFHSSPDLGEHLLGAVLHVGVERERMSAPGTVRCVSRSSIASPSASLVRRRSPSRPPRYSSSEYSRPAEAVAVGAGHAEQLRGHPLARVEALELGDELEALDLHPLDAARSRGPHVAREVGEAGVAAGELAQQLVLGLAEDRRQARGDRRRVLDQVGRGGDRERGLRDGELGALAVEDRPAPRRHGDVGLLLGDGRLLERARLDDAEPDRARRRRSPAARGRRRRGSRCGAR